MLCVSEEVERNTMTKAATLSPVSCDVSVATWVTCEENAEALRMVRQELAEVKKEHPTTTSSGGIKRGLLENPL